MAPYAMELAATVRGDAVTAQDRRVLVPLVTPVPLEPGDYRLDLLIQAGPDVERLELMTETRGGAPTDGAQGLPRRNEGSSRMLIPVSVTASEQTTWRGRFVLRLQAEKSAKAISAMIGRFDLMKNSGGQWTPVAQFPITPGADLATSVQFNAALQQGSARVLLSDPAARLRSLQILSLQTEHPYRVWMRRDSLPPRLHLDNRSDARMAGRLEVEYEAHNTPARRALQHAIQVEPGKSAFLDLPRPEHFGPVVVRAKLTSEDGAVRQWLERFAAVDAVEPATTLPDLHKAFYLGTANGARIGDSEEETRRLIDVSALLGARYIRMTRHWPQVQPKRDELHWGRMDLIADQAHRHNMRLQVVVGPPPKWAVDPAYGPDPAKSNTLPPDLNVYREYLDALVRRYADRISFYEVWNEPDIGFYTGTLEQYLGVLRVSHDVISQVDPEGLVMTGGFTGFVHPGRKPGFQETVLRDAKGQFDLHTLHMHGPFDTFWNGLTQRVIRFRESAHVNEPLAFNETGMDTRFGEAHQAATLPKKIAAARYAGARVYVWYSITDHPKSKEDPRKMGFSYGLIDAAGQPKASLVTYATAARYIAEPTSRFIERWTFAPDADDDRFGFMFARADGSFATLLWSENPRCGEAVVLVRVPGGASAELVDLMGNRTPLPVQDGRVFVPVRQEPAYLLTSARPVYEQVALIARQQMGADEPTARITTTAAAGRWSIGTTRNAENQGRGASTWSLPVAAERASGASARAETEAPHAIVRYRVDETIAGELHVALQSPVLLNDSGGTDRAPDFEIRRVEQVFNRYEHDPSTAARLWQGAEDASARLWLERKDRQWILTVEVTDDQHLSTHDGVDVVRGDSIEWAMKAAGTTDGVAFALGANAKGEVVFLSRRTGEQGWKPASAQAASVQRLSPSLTRYTARVDDAMIADARQLEMDLRLNDTDGDRDQWETRLSLQTWADEKPLGEAGVWLRLR
jgi:hypothetical protein